MAKRTKTHEEKRLRLQLLDWGRWRQSQSYGVGYTNPNNDGGHDDCFDEEMSEKVNQHYCEMRELKGNKIVQAKMLRAKYEYGRTHKEIADHLGIGISKVVQQLDRAEGWIDCKVNYGVPDERLIG